MSADRCALIVNGAICDPAKKRKREATTNILPRIAYHPAQEAYKNVLRDGLTNTVVVLGPGNRGLNPFYAFPELIHAIAIDLFDPHLANTHSSKSHEYEPCPIPEVAGALETIAMNGQDPLLGLEWGLV